jgi:hypothetical protein
MKVDGLSTIEQLDAVVRESLVSLAAELGGGFWKGQREREVVSLFCFGHLLPRCKPGLVLHDPTQLSIEVAVPQIGGQRGLTGKEHDKS